MALLSTKDLANFRQNFDSALESFRNATDEHSVRVKESDFKKIFETSGLEGISSYVQTSLLPFARNLVKFEGFEIIDDYSFRVAENSGVIGGKKINGFTLKFFTKTTGYLRNYKETQDFTESSSGFAVISWLANTLYQLSVQHNAKRQLEVMNNRFKELLAEADVPYTVSFMLRSESKRPASSSCDVFTDDEIVFLVSPTKAFEVASFLLFAEIDELPEIPEPAEDAETTHTPANGEEGIVLSEEERAILEAQRDLIITKQERVEKAIQNTITSLSALRTTVEFAKNRDKFVEVLVGLTGHHHVTPMIRGAYMYNISSLRPLRKDFVARVETKLEDGQGIIGAVAYDYAEKKFSPVLNPVTTDKNVPVDFDVVAYAHEVSGL